MSLRPAPTRRLGLAPVALAATLLIASGSAAAEDAASADETAGAKHEEPRETMHRVFASVTELLPLALDPDKFASPKRREKITHLLDDLAKSVDHLNEHADTRDLGFRYLSRSLGSDVEEARARFKRGRYEGSRFFVIESTKKCIACHSRLPSARDFPLAENLTEDIRLDVLSPQEKARLYVLTRNFHAALDTWEAIFADPEETPAHFDMSGDLLDYLTVALRVEVDPKRAQKTIAKLSKREDLPPYLAKQLAAWRDTLGEYAKSAADPPSVKAARDWIGEIDPESLGGGLDTLVRDLIASSILLRWIDEQSQPSPELAEAFYWLGVTEARSTGAFWIPQAEYHLEMAVRFDPQGPYAQPAYDLLKLQLELGYGGSGGVHLPTDAWVTLNDLEKLMSGEDE